MSYISIQSAAHAKTGETYSVGDIVCIYQGRFGHNNIMTIKSLWQNTKDPIEGGVYVCPDKKINQNLTHLGAVKHKLTEKRVKEIQQAKQIARNYDNIDL